MIRCIGVDEGKPCGRLIVFPDFAPAQNDATVTCSRCGRMYRVTVELLPGKMVMNKKSEDEQRREWGGR